MSDGPSEQWQRQHATMQAENDELLRQQRHHEVLCLVLTACGEYVAPTDQDPRNSEDWARRCVTHAKFVADLAYPPPKEQS